MHTPRSVGRLRRILGLAVATQLVLIAALTGAAPALAADPVGDPPLTSYPWLDGLSATSYATMAVSTTRLPCDSNGSDKPMTRSQALTRARSWLETRVPYSQERCYRNKYGDYRTDCSGFVSMAWGLGGSAWTGNLDEKSSVIARSALKPGDALLRYTGNPRQNHVALFVKWADEAHTRPVVIEQTGSRDTIKNTWSQSNASLYTPVRYDNIVEDTEPQPEPRVPFGKVDYNGDNKSDLAFFRPSGGAWWIHDTNDDPVRGTGTQYGAAGDIPVPGDYNGDDRSDLAFFRPSTGTWWIHDANDDPIKGTGIQYGKTGDIPVPGDYNGDGKSDLALFRPSTGTWWIHDTNNDPIKGTGIQYGKTGDIPVPGDYNGDGKSDLALFRPSTGTWWIHDTNNDPIQGTGIQYGANGDIPVTQLAFTVVN